MKGKKPLALALNIRVGKVDKNRYFFGCLPKHRIMHKIR